MKNNRTISFMFIALIYAVASLTGIFCFKFLSLPLWLNLLVADIVATVVTFIFSLIFNNASVYDPYWSVQPIVILLAFIINKPLNLFQILMFIVVTLWGIRLTANWAYTFKNLTHQDWRYTMLKEKTGKLYFFVNLFGIHLVPTLVVYACTLPAVYVMLSNNVANVFSYIFLFVSLCAIILQGTADCQMHKFRKNRTNEKFIRTGLWKHSRHPNYLGEILMWWGIALASVLFLQARWYLVFGAICNTLLFLFISIPLADKRQSRKEGFMEYKKETRMLLPIKKFQKK